MQRILRFSRCAAVPAAGVIRQPGGAVLASELHPDRPRSTRSRDAHLPSLFAAAMPAGLALITRTRRRSFPFSSPPPSSRACGALEDRQTTRNLAKGRGLTFQPVPILTEPRAASRETALITAVKTQYDDVGHHLPAQFSAIRWRDGEDVRFRHRPAPVLISNERPASLRRLPNLSTPGTCRPGCPGGAHRVVMHPG
jgi:hypothetical protein